MAGDTEQPNIGFDLDKRAGVGGWFNNCGYNCIAHAIIKLLKDNRIPTDDAYDTFLTTFNEYYRKQATWEDLRTLFEEEYTNPADQEMILAPVLRRYYKKLMEDDAVKKEELMAKFEKLVQDYIGTPWDQTFRPNEGGDWDMYHASYAILPQIKQEMIETSPQLYKLHQLKRQYFRLVSEDANTSQIGKEIDELETSYHKEPPAEWLHKHKSRYEQEFNQLVQKWDAEQPQPTFEEFIAIISKELATSNANPEFDDTDQGQNLQRIYNVLETKLVDNTPQWLRRLKELRGNIKNDQRRPPAEMWFLENLPKYWNEGYQEFLNLHATLKHAKQLEQDAVQVLCKSLQIAPEIYAKKTLQPIVFESATKAISFLKNEHTTGIKPDDTMLINGKVFPVASVTITDSHVIITLDDSLSDHKVPVEIDHIPNKPSEKRELTVPLMTLKIIHEIAHWEFESEDAESHNRQRYNSENRKLEELEERTYTFSGHIVFKEEIHKKLLTEIEPGQNHATLSSLIEKFYTPSGEYYLDDYDKRQIWHDKTLPTLSLNRTQPTLSLDSNFVDFWNAIKLDQQLEGISDEIIFYAFIQEIGKLYVNRDRKQVDKLLQGSVSDVLDTVIKKRSVSIPPIKNLTTQGQTPALHSYQLAIKSPRKQLGIQKAISVPWDKVKSSFTRPTPNEQQDDITVKTDDNDSDTLHMYKQSQEVSTITHVTEPTKEHVDFRFVSNDPEHTTIMANLRRAQIIAEQSGDYTLTIFGAEQNPSRSLEIYLMAKLMDFEPQMTAHSSSILLEDTTLKEAYISLCHIGNEELIKKFDTINSNSSSSTDFNSILQQLTADPTSKPTLTA